MKLKVGDKLICKSFISFKNGATYIPNEPYVVADFSNKFYTTQVCVESYSNRYWFNLDGNEYPLVRDCFYNNHELRKLKLININKLKITKTKDELEKHMWEQYPHEHQSELRNVMLETFEFLIGKIEK